MTADPQTEARALADDLQKRAANETIVHPWHAKAAEELITALAAKDAELEAVKRERRAGFESLGERIDLLASGLAVNEWFKAGNENRSGEEVEKFSRDIRRALFDAACDLAAPYRDRAERAEAAIVEKDKALEPFAACVDQISPDEDDEEWAKFRLLVKDFRAARRARGGE